MRTEILQGNTINPAAWNNVVENSPQGSVFLYHHFLTAIAHTWQGILVYDDADNLTAIFPIYVETKFRFSIALQPILSKYWGVCMAAVPFKNDYEKYNYYKKIVDAIISKIPDGIKYFSYNMHPSFNYPLPFAKAGYHLKSKYTLRLNLNPNYEELQTQYQDKMRSEIRKAERAELRMQIDADTKNLEEILLINKADGKEFIKPKFLDALHRIFNALNPTGQVKIISILTKEGEVAASCMVLHDAHAAYYIIANKNPKFIEQAPMQFMTAEAIRYFSDKLSTFDFVSGMSPNFEFFFRRFGAAPVQYNCVERRGFPFSLLR
ncbi:MAG: GNAT family N-acetyltransferase [Bacteroidetes bacterium]|nr:GNAT family N-acetyltransferase [Bacteroidota bacterium]